VNSEHPIIDQWTLGGGTAMMLQIGHRESHDIDIFFHDPQFLGFLHPQTRDFELEIQLGAFAADGTRSLKLTFDKIGEIDFIVARALTSSPAALAHIDGQSLLLETIPEIIAKKVCNRGSMIRPRDIFDIAAAGEHHRDSIVAALKQCRGEVAQALAAIERLNAEFVNGAIGQLAIREEYRTIATAAISKSKEILHAI
jgi:hypothetical protein